MFDSLSAGYHQDAEPTTEAPHHLAWPDEQALADAEPLALSAFDSPDPDGHDDGSALDRGTPDDETEDDGADEQVDQLVEICSAISSESGRPVTWRELNELRLYLGRRLGVQPSGAAGDGSEPDTPLTREEVEAQLEAIRARSD